MNKIQERGKCKILTLVMTIIYILIFPVAPLAALSKLLNESNNVIINRNRIKMTVYFGTSFNHSDNKYGVSIIMGIANIKTKKKESLI